MTLNPSNDRAALLKEAVRRKRAAAGNKGGSLPSRPPGEAALISEMQRSLWLLYRMDPASAAYNVASAFRTDARLDQAALQRSLNEVVSRHRVLRSTFQAHRDTALQIIHPHSPLSLDVVQADVGDAERVAVRAARERFDLEHGPLIRLVLVEEPLGSTSLLVLVVHHIVADERSIGRLWTELADAYTGKALDAAPTEQFDDYVYWSSRQGVDPEPELDYWRRTLDPLPTDLVLPLERSDAAETVPRGRLLRRTVGPQVQSTIRRLAGNAGTTPFTVFAFAFRLLLERYGSGPDVVFATPVSTRSHPAVADMVGYFLNPVVIRTAIDEERSTRDNLREFARETLEALAHASVPFDVLAGELSPVRRADRHPIFQVMFVYQELPRVPTLGDAHVVPVALDLQDSKFDLTLLVSEGEDAVELAVEFRADRFDESSMQRLLAHFETLVEHLSDHADRPTAELPMLPPDEEDRLRTAWQGRALDLAATDLVPQQILDCTQNSSTAPAVISGDMSWSYGELGRIASRISHALTEHGVQPGDRVGLYLDRSPLLVAAVVGAHWAGAAYVPLDPSYPATRNAEILGDAGVSAVLTTSSMRQRLPEGAWATLTVDDLPAADTHVTLDHLDADSLAYVLYTSGSTGRPKGVVVTHDNLRASTAARRVTYEAAPKRFLLLPSIAFDSSVAGIFWTLASGGALVVPTDDEVVDARRLVQLVTDARVTTLLCVPSLYAQMLRFGGDRLRGLDTVIVAGEVCPSHLVQEHFRVVPEVRLFNEYGPTEATVWATAHEVTSRDAERPVPIGSPIPGVDVHVLDTRGRRVPVGIPGQAWIAGRTVAQGYWKRRDLTERHFVPDHTASEKGTRTYRTGDRVAWTAEGTLLFLGREDDQIKLRGFRIEPGEIESLLLEQSDVEDAAVVARGPKGDPVDSGFQEPTQLVAFLETTGQGANLSRRDVLLNRLPDFMVPQRFVELQSLPRLPNGKLDRTSLRRMALEVDSSDDVTEAQQPATDQERALMALWEGLLGRSGIGVTDNFFELGGHSLLVVEMAHAIERDHGVTLVAADVFQNPTIRELARRVERNRGSVGPQYAHLFPIQPGGRDTPFIVCIPHFFSQMLAERFRGKRPVYGLRGVGLRPEGNVGRWPTMTDLGRELVDEVCRRFPGERYIMAGYSFGASMAFEAVRQMEEQGLPVERLYLIAPMPLDFVSVGPLRVQVGGLRQPIEALSFWEVARLMARDLDPRTRRPYDRAFQLLCTRPWRRLLCLVGKLRTLAGFPLTPRILHADVRLERFRLHRRFRPQPVRTPTVVFNPREPTTDTAATWRPHFEGPFTVVDTPDPHGDASSIEQARALILRRLDHDEAEGS